MGLAALRAREKRWRRLGQVADSLAALFEATVRLDVYDPIRPYGANSEYPSRHEVRVERFERQLAHLEAFVSRERDRVTVERLTLDLAIKKGRHAVLPPATVCEVVATEPFTIPDVDAFWLDIGRPHDPTCD